MSVRHVKVSNVQSLAEALIEVEPSWPVVVHMEGIGDPKVIGLLIDDDKKQVELIVD